MGGWVEEKRHGCGLVVTQYGTYYEGTFRDDKMSVSLLQNALHMSKHRPHTMTLASLY